MIFSIKFFDFRLLLLRNDGRCFGGTGHIIALDEVAAETNDRFQLLFRLHALRDTAHFSRFGKFDEVGDHLLPFRVLIDVSHQQNIDFDEIGETFQQNGFAVIARTVIVQSDVRAAVADALQLILHGVVGGAFVFGKLHDDIFQLFSVKCRKLLPFLVFQVLAGHRVDEQPTVGNAERGKIFDALKKRKIFHLAEAIVVARHVKDVLRGFESGRQGARISAS